MIRSRQLQAVLIAAAAAGFLTACGGDKNVVREPAELKPIEVERLEVERVWKTDTGEGAGNYVSGYTLGFDGRNLYTAHRDGRVVALDRETGERVWRVDTETRVISGPAIGRDRLVLGTRDGQILALSLEDGSELWRTDVSGEVIAPPAIGENRVVAYSQDGRMGGFDLQNGSRRWTVQRSVPPLTLRGNASPIVSGDTVIAGLDNGRVVALDIGTGELRWEQLISAPSGRSELERAVDIDAPLLLVEDEIYAGSLGGEVASLSSSTGRVRWKRDITTRTGFSFDLDQVFTTDVESKVWALDRASGAVNWSSKALDLRGLSAPVMWKGYVLVGDFEGYLHWMIPEDGTIIARARPLRDAIRIAPIVLDGRIYILSEEGDVAAIKAEFVELDPEELLDEEEVVEDDEVIEEESDDETSEDNPYGFDLDFEDSY